MKVFKEKTLSKKYKHTTNMPTAKKTVKKTVKRVVRRVPKKKAAVQKNTAVATNVAPVVAVAAPVVVETTPAVQTNTTAEWENTWDTILEQTSTLAKTVRTLNTSLKKVHKQWARALKDARKQSSKKKRNSNTKRAPSGFAKPSRISSELCAFLGKPEGTEMARTEVTRLLTQYIKTNSLQDPQNKRKIVPDAQLTSLLQVGDNAELTYFNLQKYMKRHFPKSAAATAATTTTTTTTTV